MARARCQAGEERLRPFDLAEVVASLLRPGGFLYLAEFHPVSGIFGDEDLTVVHDYFVGEEPQVWDEPGTHAHREAETVHNHTYEWNHIFNEHGYTLFPRWPFLVKSGFDTYRLPERMPRLSLMYSLRARKPASG